MSVRPGIALGVLAGGAGRRVQGRDKGWIDVDGVPAIERVVQALRGQVDAVLVSANRNLHRYRAVGAVITDAAAGVQRHEDFPGPMAGVVALLSTCPQPLLLTVPVDVEAVPADVVGRMHGALGDPCDAVVAVDEESLQPLVALYRTHLADAARTAFALGQRSVRDWQQGLRSVQVRFDGFRFGNRNTVAPGA